MRLHTPEMLSKGQLVRHPRLGFVARFVRLQFKPSLGLIVSDVSSDDDVFETWEVDADSQVEVVEPDVE